MAKEVTITIHWDSGITQVFQPSRKKGWRITQRDGVQLMIIHEKDSGLRHEIPLAGVFYWTVATVISADVGGDQYDWQCYKCETFFTSSDYHLHLSHGVGRACCGSSPMANHHPSCSRRDSESNQRIGQDVDIHNDDNGISFTTKLVDNLSPKFERILLDIERILNQDDS